MNELYTPLYPLSKEAEAIEDGALMMQDMMVENQLTMSASLPADSIAPSLLSLSMAFVPQQAWETPYDLEMAMERGTIFPALDLPFMGTHIQARKGG